MDVKGPFPKRMLKKGAFTVKHFEADPGMSFKLYEDDPVTRKPVGASHSTNHAQPLTPVFRDEVYWSTLSYNTAFDEISTATELDFCLLGKSRQACGRSTLALARISPRVLHC